MQSCELALSISTLACCIAEGKSPEEIALISSIFMQLGDTLATIAAHQARSQKTLIDPTLSNHFSTNSYPSENHPTLKCC